MKVISSAELRNNLKKYLDLATSETVIIQRGKTETFFLHAEQRLTPDADLARAITFDKLWETVEKDLEKIFSEEKK